MIHYVAEDDVVHDEDFEDEALFNCGKDRAGDCSKAGSEECELDCPFSGEDDE